MQSTLPLDTMKLVPLLAAVAVVLGTDLAPMDAAATEFQGQVLNYQLKTIYHSPETPGYTSWVGLWQLPDGRLRTDCVQLTGPTASPTVALPLLESQDNGATWNHIATTATQVVLLDGIVQSLPVGSGRGMAVLPNGTLVRPVQPPLYDGNSTGHVERSTDGGSTWSRISVQADPNSRVYPTVIRPLSDGRLVLMAGTYHGGDLFSNITKTMFISSDQGQTWGSPITLMSKEQGVCEESDFAELPDGDLLWIHRVHHYSANGTLLGVDRRQSITRKVGDTFVPEAPSSTPPFSGGGFPCELMTREGVILDLDSNGSHWSSDWGQTWHSLMLGDESLHTFYYPKAVQTEDGTIVVVGHLGNDNAYGTVDQSIVMQSFRLSAIHTPEPSAFTLLGIGAAGLLASLFYRRWYNHIP